MVDKFIRARQPRDKATRRLRLLKAAGKALDRRTFQDLTLQEIAEASGISKATAYGYFDSKGALFLALLDQEMEAWAEGLASWVPAPPDDLARALTEDLEGRPRLQKLLAVLHLMLEPSVSLEEVVAFKTAMLVRLEGMARTLHHLHPALPVDAAIPLFLRLYTFLVGLAQVTSVPARHAELLRDPRFAPLQIERSRELHAMLDLLLKEFP